MAYYIDAFLLPLPTNKVKTYQRISAKAGKIWMDHGALEYRECVGDDLFVQGLLSFTKPVKTKPGETVVFSWILYKSRKHRDAVNAKVMADERMMEPPDMPFDMKRMAMGGFKTLVDLERKKRR